MVWKFSTINRDEIYMTILIMRRFSIFNGTYLFLKMSHIVIIHLKVIQELLLSKHQGYNINALDSTQIYACWQYYGVDGQISFHKGKIARAISSAERL